MFVQKQVTEDLKAIWEQLQYRGSAGRLVKMVKWEKQLVEKFVLRCKFRFHLQQQNHHRKPSPTPNIDLSQIPLNSGHTKLSTRESIPATPFSQAGQIEVDSKTVKDYRGSLSPEEMEDHERLLQDIIRYLHGPHQNFKDEALKIYKLCNQAPGLKDTP